MLSSLQLIVVVFVAVVVVVVLVVVEVFFVVVVFLVVVVVLVVLVVVRVVVLVDVVVVDVVVGSNFNTGYSIFLTSPTPIFTLIYLKMKSAQNKPIASR